MQTMIAFAYVDSIQTLIDLQSKYAVLSQWSLFDAAVSMEKESNNRKMRQAEIFIKRKMRGVKS